MTFDYALISKKILSYLFDWAGGIAILLFGLFAVRIFGKVFKRVLSHTDLEETLQYFAVKVARITARVFVIVMALSAVGVDVGPLIAGIGVAGFVVGFALKDTLSNLSAGIMLLFYGPFEKGDSVELLGGKVKGVVEAIDVPATILIAEGQKIIVPNSKIWGDVIINLTQGKVVDADQTEVLSRPEEDKKKDKKEKKEDKNKKGKKKK